MANKPTFGAKDLHGRKGELGRKLFAKDIIDNAGDASLRDESLQYNDH